MGAGDAGHPETPWLLIATVIGIVVVSGAAFTYFTSAGVSSAGHTSTSTTTPQETTGTSIATFATTISQTPNIVSTTQIPTNIPASGVIISVSYLGGFNGSYRSRWGNYEYNKLGKSGIHR